MFSGFLLQLQTLFYCNLWKIFIAIMLSMNILFIEYSVIIVRYWGGQRPTKGRWFLLHYFLITNYGKFFSLLPIIKFELWCHSILIVSFIYLIRTHLSHTTKLWCHRTSLIVCAYFENFEIAYFKKSTSCFKPINSWLKKYGLS